MNENVVFKLDAGKNIGDYNLARCRHVTNKSDKFWLEALGLSDLWEEIKLEQRTGRKDFLRGWDRMNT